MAELDEDDIAQVTIEVEQDQSGNAVVSLVGELDISTVGALDEALGKITAARHERLIFDLGGLRFMDSAGIAALVRPAGQVDEICIRDPSPIVRRVIEATGLTGVLKLES
jgi:anti-sigma B factor antagonist